MSFWPRAEKGLHFVENWDPTEVPFDENGNVDFEAWFSQPAPVERPLLPVIQPDPPRLTRGHFPRPYGPYWQRVEHLIGSSLWYGTRIRLPWHGLAYLTSYREEGDYVWLKGRYCSEERFHRFAWIECP